MDIQIPPVCGRDLLWDREGLSCIVEKVYNSQTGIMKLLEECHFGTTVKEIQMKSITRLTWQQRDNFIYSGIIYFLYKNE